ncbi:MAG: phenylacetate-CoA oxygenase subunit PaaJ [Gammaproteobacteria bacterium]|nr:phenylacetate-CoA oxygenase subunit PaaJ [Gammaproteobacteria bacterium]
MELKTIPILSPEFAQRRAVRLAASHPEIWDLLDGVYDPELPGLTIWDLGVLQDVRMVDGVCEVDITLTYSGCPAVDAMTKDIKKVLNDSGYEKIDVKVVLSPVWSTAMMSPEGKAHLKQINIAPPSEKDEICCPQCESSKVHVISQFGSTACKALYQCNDCHETFDYFKHF